jgi:FkbM family methyltransferase
MTWAYRLFLDREPENRQVTKTEINNTQSLRRLLWSSQEFRMKNPDLVMPDTWVIKETIHGFRLWVCLPESGVSRPILSDTYDIAETKFIKKYVPSGALTMDVGANIGFYTQLLASVVGPNGTVLAFEPLAYLYDAALKSTAENHFGDRVKIYDKAVGAEPGHLKLRHAPITTNFGGAHFAPDTQTPVDHVDVDVEVTPLDTYRTSQRVNFIKMDIEGAEPFALQGAQKIICRDRPIILTEIHPAQLSRVARITAKEYADTLIRLGYSLHLLNENGEADGKLDPDSVIDPINVVCLPLES